MYDIDRIIGHSGKGAMTKYRVLWVPVGDQAYGDISEEPLDRVRHTQAFTDYVRQRRMGRGGHVDASECEWPAAVEQMLESAGVNVNELDQGTQDRFAQARFRILHEIFVAETCTHSKALLTAPLFPRRAGVEEGGGSGGLAPVRAAICTRGGACALCNV